MLQIEFTGFFTCKLFVFYKEDKNVKLLIFGHL